MSDKPANHFGISTDLSLFLWLHAPLWLFVSAAAVFFKRCCFKSLLGNVKFWK